MSSVVEFASSNIIDSTDVENRIQEIEDELNELKNLKKFANEYNEEWAYGVPLINDNYFKEYARDLAIDIEAIDPYADWPLTYIDWDAAAEMLK